MQVGSLVKRKLLPGKPHIVTKIFRNKHGGLRVNVCCIENGYLFEASRPSEWRVLSR